MCEIDYTIESLDPFSLVTPCITLLPREEIQKCICLLKYVLVKKNYMSYIQCDHFQLYYVTFVYKKYSKVNNALLNRIFI